MSPRIFSQGILRVPAARCLCVRHDGVLGLNTLYNQGISSQKSQGKQIVSRICSRNAKFTFIQYIDLPCFFL
jgi:hypothetical protein